MNGRVVEVSTCVLWFKAAGRFRKMRSLKTFLPRRPVLVMPNSCGRHALSMSFHGASVVMLVDAGWWGWHVIWRVGVTWWLVGTHDLGV